MVGLIRRGDLLSFVFVVLDRGGGGFAVHSLHDLTVGKDFVLEELVVLHGGIIFSTDNLRFYSRPSRGSACYLSV